MPVVALDSNSVGHEIVGPADAPVVVALGGISASRRVHQWWAAIVGDGRFIDTTRSRVLGIEWVDGGVAANGRPVRTVSTHDQADHLAATLDALEITAVHALVGASYGGMVGLAFAERYPNRVEQLVIISAPAQPHPLSTALRSIQRHIVELGLDAGREFDAMVLARALAMTTYRSATNFAERFDASSVESYLWHQGRKFARRFSAARFLALSHSADTHRVNPELITTPATFVAADGDRIVPREQMVELADRWAGRSRLVPAPSHVGHDAFLAEPEIIGPILRNALRLPTRS